MYADVSQEPQSEIGLDQILRTIAKGGLDTIGGQQCAVGLLEDGELVFRERWNGYAWQTVDLRFQPGEGIPGWVMQHKRPYIFGGPAVRVADGLAPAHIPDVHSSLSAPILNEQDQILGVLELYEVKGERPFTARDIHMLDLLAKQASIAIGHAELLQRSRKRILELSILNHISATLIATLNIEDILHSIARVVCRFMGYSLCGILLHDSERDRLQVKSLCGTTEQWDVEEINRRCGFEDNIVGWVYYHRAPQLISHIVAGTNPTGISDRIRCELAVPLTFKNKTFGVLLAGHTRPHALTEDDVRFMATMSSNLSLAIKNAELFETINRQSCELKELVQEQTRELADEKRFVETIIDTLPVGLYVVDRAFRVVAWNKTREAGEAGILRERALGKNLLEVLHKADRRQLTEQLNQVFQTGALCQFERHDAFDDHKAYLVKRVPMSVSGKEVSHVITISEDITEMRKMNQALLSSEKLASLGQMAAGVAHEINNPLAAIASCAEALTSLARAIRWERQEDAQDCQEYLRIIEEEVYRCKNIIDGLLDFSRTKQAEKRDLYIHSILDSVLLLLKHHPRFKHIQVSKKYQTGLPKVHGDAEQLKQVFLALALNAVDAMNEHGMLTITTHATEDRRSVRIDVADTGCGIPPQYLKKIFDPFFTTKPPGKGTGLGLSICYRIITDHQGAIEVASQVDKGTTFTVRLPGV